MPDAPPLRGVLDVPPADVPPAEVPPADVPPAEVPPAAVPPAEVPPADVPPAGWLGAPPTGRSPGAPPAGTMVPAPASPSGGVPASLTGPGTVETRADTSSVQTRSPGAAGSMAAQTRPGSQSSSRKQSVPALAGSCGPPQATATSTPKPSGTKRLRRFARLMRRTSQEGEKPSSVRPRRGPRARPLLLPPGPP
jgi:hypothetical protein